MQLVILCREKDLKQFGPDKVFGPLVKDLKHLESVGLDVGNDLFIKGSLFCILGDNLGSHMVGGFVESFSGKHVCRYCLAERSEMLHESFAIRGEKRTQENYQESVQIVLSEGLNNHKGIKQSSIFNELQHFHVVSGLPPCIGHDLFEGILAYDMKLVTDYFVITKRWFTYDQLNKRLIGFPYTGYDALDKPCAVNPTSDRMPGHAVQNWVFIRLFSLFVGKYVADTEVRVWAFFLLIKKLVEIVCTQSFEVCQIAILNSVIEDYLHERKEIFNVQMRPKHHYLVHYPELILKFGPLIRLWTLRFESKHSYFKKCARKLQNYKSLAKTLSQKHQLLQALYNSGSLFPNEFEVEILLPFHPEMYSENIKAVLSGCGLTGSNSMKATKVCIRGITYKLGNTLVISQPTSYEMLVGCIQDIFVEGNTVYFLVHEILCTYIDAMDLYAYESSLDHDYDVQCLTLSQFADCYTVEIYFESGTSYISLKHSLSQ
ncbi:uncharacterized protein LOC125384259 [Haliotis rufescens]|uniref:uncharacterized protein LOC125384259 n=1 Tax=Haliotis rufescens TaxID=6454 RepID=UPI00201EDE13|nr:uncharacterized protein LOC125384259 [Haliotis rufescens]